MRNSLLFVKLLLWIGGLLILAAIAAKMGPLYRTAAYFGAKPSSFLMLANSVLLLAIGIGVLQRHMEG
jgi:hypothetical protein